MTTGAGMRSGQWNMTLVALASLVVSTALILFNPPYRDLEGTERAIGGLLLVLGLTALCLSVSVLLRGFGSRRVSVALMVALLLAIFVFQSEPVGYPNESDRPWLSVLDEGYPLLFPTIQLACAVVLLFALVNTVINTAAPSPRGRAARVAAGSAWAAFLLALIINYHREYDIVPAIAVTLALWWQAALMGTSAGSPFPTAPKGWAYLDIALAGTLLLPPLLMVLSLSVPGPGY